MLHQLHHLLGQQLPQWMAHLQCCYLLEALQLAQLRNQASQASRHVHDAAPVLSLWDISRHHTMTNIMQTEHV
jgi:hypothetical protein